MKQKTAFGNSLFSKAKEAKIKLEPPKKRAFAAITLEKGYGPRKLRSCNYSRSRKEIVAVSSIITCINTVRALF
jgi:hypothetical protein